MGEIIVSMKNICKSFPGVKALDRVDFELRSGEVLALLGENGAGKSTLVKLLTGLYTPDAGKIYYDGNDLDTISRDSLSEVIGALSQEYVSYHLSIRDNVGIRAPQTVRNEKQTVDVVKPPEHTQW